MCEIRYGTDSDKDFWYSLDKDLCVDEFERKIRDKRGYIISIGSKPIGIMRYNLMWDNTPFLTLIYIVDAEYGRGYGKKAMLFCTAILACDVYIQLSPFAGSD